MDLVRWETPLLVLLAVTAAGSASAAPFAYVANHGDDAVSIIDTATNQVTGSVPVGNLPLGVAVDPEGARVYVTNQDGANGSVSVIDTAGNSVTPVDVGDDPTGIAVKLPGTRVYVANRVDRTVSVIDTATNEVIATVPVEDNPLGVAINPAGTPAYVVNKGSDSLTLIDTDTNQAITTVSVGPPGSNPTHVAVSPAGDRLYVSDNGGAMVAVVNATTLDVTGTITVGGFPEGVVFSPDGTRAYVANSGPDTLSIIDTASETVVKTIDVGDQPEDVSIHPNGTRVYVLNRNDKSVSVIDTATNSEIDADGNAANGLTRIAVGVGPVALGEALIPALRPPRFGKSALACQAAIAAKARAFAKIDQGQQTTCQSRILKDLSGGKDTQQHETLCAFALDLGNPKSSLAKARTAARKAVIGKCAALAPAAVNGPCNRGASSLTDAADCILDQHKARVAEMVADTFAPGDPKVLTKTGLACQATIAKAATRLAQNEHKALGGCLLRILKDAAKGKPVALAATACAKSLDPSKPSATLTSQRAALTATIALKCAGLAPADIGTPCDPAATTVAQTATCVLRAQARRVEKMVAAEFNDACPMLTAVGLGRAYPDVCSGH